MGMLLGVFILVLFVYFLLVKMKGGKVVSGNWDCGDDDDYKGY